VRNRFFGNRLFPLTLLTCTILVTGMLVGSSCTNSASAKPKFVFKDAPKGGVVAKVGGKEISEEELLGESKIEFFDLKKKEYELKMERLNALMVELLIGQEAKKAGMTTEDYISKKIMKGDSKVSDAEFKQFVKEKQVPEAQITPQIKERINNFIISQKKEKVLQAYLAGLTKSNPVEVYFQKPKMDIKIELGKAPAIGPEKASVKIVAFSDFQCPYCSRGAKTIHDIKKKYGNKVQIAFKHFPLSFHKDARPAAEASMCINEQSSDKFWKFHDVVFENQKDIGNADFLEKQAQKVGADMAKYKACMAEKKFASFVDDDMKYGEKIGVRSTPTFFVNGQIVQGALPIESFSEIIDEALEDAKGS